MSRSLGSITLLIAVQGWAAACGGDDASGADAGTTGEDGGADAGVEETCHPISGVVSATGDDSHVWVAGTIDGGFMTAATFSGELSYEGESYMAADGAIVLTRRASGGTPLWTRVFGGEGSATLDDLAVTPDGDAWLIGPYEGEIDFGTDSAAAGVGTFLLHVGQEGRSEALWTFGADGNGAVAVAPGGDVYFGARYREAISVGGVELAPRAAELCSYMVAKLGRDGSVAWAQGLSGSRGALAAHDAHFWLTTKCAESARLVEVDSEGEEVVAASIPYSFPASLAAMLDGGVAHSSWSRPTSVQRYDVDGERRWARGLGELSAIFDVAAGPAGTLAVTGGFGATLELEGEPIASSAVADTPNLFVLQLDSDGSFAEVETLSSADLVEGRSVAYDDRGGLLVGGRMEGEVDLPSGSHAAQGVDGFWLRLCPSEP